MFSTRRIFKYFLHIYIYLSYNHDNAYKYVLIKKHGVIYMPHVKDMHTR